MEIEYIPLFECDTQTDQVADFIEGSMEDRMHDGQLERVQQTGRNCARAFGRLVEILADKGVLTVDEVVAIADKGVSEARFLPRDR